jgi:predicted MFS family arabinose efflux permease
VSSPQITADPPASRAPRRAPRELAILLTLAAVQFTHIVDFMIVIPLGPQLMRLLDVGPQPFSLLVSVYMLAAAASGFVAAFWIDRYDRKRALLALYCGFIVATALCGLAPNYPLLLLARFGAGVFGGVIGSLVLAIVADLVPYARRASATAIVAASFSLAAVAGVPLALWLASVGSWRLPFLLLAALSIAFALAAMRLLPPLAVPLVAHQRRHPLEQLRLIFGGANHRRAFALTLMLMFAGFTVIPFIPSYLVANVGIGERDLAVVYFAGGAATLVTLQVIGRLADRYGKKRVFALVAAVSVVPILIVTHMPPLPLASVVPLTMMSFVFVTGRFGPAMALVTAAAAPPLRGSFMSFNGSIQQLGSALASFAAGMIIGRAADGSLTRFGAVGWLAVACTLACVWLARRIRIVADEVSAGQAAADAG